VKKAIFAFLALAAALIFLGLPGEAFAKAPTVKITVSGGRIRRAIEITNPQLLALSDVWRGQFLDLTRSPLTSRPSGPTSYEVSFYVKLAENNVRKMYVVYYYPNVRSEQGFIYIPPEGPLRQLNWGTIMRSALEGKWIYALPAWEALIKPVIAKSETKSRPQASPTNSLPSLHQKQIHPPGARIESSVLKSLPCLSVPISNSTTAATITTNSNPASAH